MSRIIIALVLHAERGEAGLKLHVSAGPGIVQVGGGQQHLGRGDGVILEQSLIIFYFIGLFNLIILF